MNDRPTNLDELAASIREAINNLEQYRDHPDTFTPEDHDYPEYALQQVMDDAQHAGYPSLVQTVPKRVGVRQALKMLGRMLEDHDGPLTPRQVAARLGKKRDTVLSWINSGKLRAQNVGTRTKPRYVVTPTNLEAFLNGSPPAPPRRKSGTKPPKEYD